MACIMENTLNYSATVILSLALILFAGFMITRVTKRLHLPDVTGYIVVGVLIGPDLLHLVPEYVIEGMDFVTDIAIAYIAFGVGKYFKMSHVRKNIRTVCIITLFESLTAAVLITVVMIAVFHLPVPFALLLGAIASATAPASTIMTIHQYHARGEFVDTILQVIALDNAAALIAFSICAAIAGNMENGTAAMDWKAILIPVIYIILAVLLGAFCGFSLKWIISDRRTKDHRLILINAVIFGLAGICTLVDVSPLLPCMAMGTVYVNIITNKDLFKQVNHFTPPIMLMFFVLSGMKLDVPMLASAGIIGICYFLVRIIGKFAGVFAGSLCSRAPVPVKKYLGLALIPQAGVAIGLAALGQRILPADMGAMLSVIILSSSILYELFGPACAKASLLLSGSTAK